MEQTDHKSIRVFAEYLSNLRAVNLYITLDSNYLDPSVTPVLSINSNVIQIPGLGRFKIVLNELNLEDCNDLPPRSLDNNILCYRLVVKPETFRGSVAAEIVSNFEKTVDEGAKNLVKNSINNVALKEGTFYRLECRFCSKFLSESVKFDRIRPLPSKNWVENASELWYCHPPEPTNSQGLHQDMSARLNKMHLENSNQNKSIVELLKNPDLNYCFYGPCNWAVNKDIVKFVCRNDSLENCGVSRADCSHCGNELGSFTSENCVKIWDYGVRWVENSDACTQTQDSNTHVVEEASSTADNSEITTNRAFLNFKSIVFATIYELSDHPTFRFTVSSIFKGNSIFLWNIDRNLTVYPQKSVELTSGETTILERSKVAKFFFAVRVNNLVNISDPREVLIIQESEQNEQSILTIPDYVYKVGVDKLKATSVMYSRNEQTLQCGFLPYDV